MKYVININQPKLLEFGINVNQGAILDLLCVSPTWATPEIIDNEVFYFVSRTKIAEELEAFSLKPDTIYRHLKTLDEKGLIVYKKVGKKDCIKLTDLGKTYYVGNKSEFIPNSEINPKKLGNKSEKNSEINPTYNNTNINNNTKDKKEKINKKEKKVSKLEKLNNLILTKLKENKLSSFKSKINITTLKKDLIELRYNLDDINLEELANLYVQYIQKNKNYAKRLNIFVIAYLEGNLKALNNNKSFNNKEVNMFELTDKYFEAKKNLQGNYDNFIETEIL